MPNVQKGMLAATEAVLRIVRLESGHLPMISLPEELADILRGEAGGADGGGQ